MRTKPADPYDWRTVLPVPPLARQPGRPRVLHRGENDRLVRHLMAGGIRQLLYGGNAFLYHATLAEFDELVAWLADLPDDLLAIPSLGPAYGRALDQAPLVRKHRFPMVMMLPCSDPRDAQGLEQGYRDIADEAEAPLMVYLKEETSFGGDREAGLDAVARLVSDGICQAIKYAVERPDPAQDPYLERLLERVDRRRVISGIGERPAIVHMRRFGLPGFTTGSGCLAPRQSLGLHQACTNGRWDEAEALRERFLPHEDLRDAWGASRVLHAAVALAGIAATGPVPPYASALTESQSHTLAAAARRLAAAEGEVAHLKTAAASREIG